MIDEALIYVASSGSDQHDRIIEYAEIMRAVTAPIMTDSADPLAESALVMAAAAMFAGTLYGQMVAIGLEADTPRRLRLASESAANNFKSGATAGKVGVARLMKEGGHVH